MMAPTPPPLRARQPSHATLTRYCLAYGVPFQLRAGDLHALASTLDVLPFGTEIVDGGATDLPCFTLPPRDHPRFPSLLARVEQQVLLHVALHAPDRTFLHAGVVAWQGRAIVLPGHSHAGKTTLVAELVKRGALYYSDEYALLDPAGMVHPYARDLYMREPRRLNQTKVSVTDLAGKAGTTPAFVAHVVITEFAEDAEWNPEPLSQGLAILELLRHCLPARRKPAHVLTTLKAVMRSARACRSVRGDARATAQLLLQTLSSGEPPA